MVSFKNLRKMIEIQGNGNIVSREIRVSTFIRLHLGCTGTIELHQSDEEKVIFEADENLVEYCAATNAGRTLYVSNEEGSLRKPAYTSCTVKVFFRQMNKLILRNHRGITICPKPLVMKEALDIKIQSVADSDLNIVAPALKLLCQASGNTTLRGSCEKIEIRNQCNGDFNSSSLNAGELSISNMSNGNVLLHANDSIRISHYGNGFIHYSGDANVKDVKQYGNGEIKHLSNTRG